MRIRIHSRSINRRGREIPLVRPVRERAGLGAEVGVVDGRAVECVFRDVRVETPSHEDVPLGRDAGREELRVPLTVGQETVGRLRSRVCVD